MKLTYEELVGLDLDRLYRAALFLTGGNPDHAERLVSRAVLAGSREYRSSSRLPTRTAHWFDGHLARALLDGKGIGETIDPGAGDALHGRRSGPAQAAAAPVGWYEPFSDLGFDGLARAGGALPPAQRLAFWLVALERRRYGDVAEILAVPRETVAVWIRDAHRTLHRALSVGGPGTSGRGMA